MYTNHQEIVVNKTGKLFEVALKVCLGIICHNFVIYSIYEIGPGWMLLLRDKDYSVGMLMEGVLLLEVQTGIPTEV